MAACKTTTGDQPLALVSRAVNIFMYRPFRASNPRVSWGWSHTSMYIFLELLPFYVFCLVFFGGGEEIAQSVILFIGNNRTHRPHRVL